jgi:hypothetical protein
MILECGGKATAFESGGVGRRTPGNQKDLNSALSMSLATYIRDSPARQ